MPTAFQGLRKTSFNGIEFPVEHITLHSQGRQHVHEYPHAPGGAPEKLGRGLWYLTVRGNFSSNSLVGYQGDLWPGRMNALRQLYESQTTATFVHPTQGEFQAFIVGWKQEYDPGHIQSGEKVDIEFLEDQRTAYLTQTQVSAGSSLVYSQAAADAALAATLANLGSPLSAAQMGLFDQLRALTNAVSAVGDTVGIYSQLYLSQVSALIGCCSQLQDSFAAQGSNMAGIADAVRDVWAQAQSAASAVTNQNQVSEWTVPQTMSIVDIASRIYGDASRQSDLLVLNPGIVNPYAVPAGFDITYFPAG